MSIARDTMTSAPSAPSICLLIPYFGNWPFWFPLFLYSCRYNPSIDWILYTDCGVPADCPDNVRVVSISYQDYCRQVSGALAIDFQPSQAYKLCDIKPALGHIHQADIAGYEFWGFGDIDLVYGDLRAYFTTARLQAKSLFSTTGRRVAGHLCLLRNTAQMRTAFMRVAGWQALFSQQAHVAFDERQFSRLFLRHKNSPALVRWLAARFDPWLRLADFEETFVTPNASIRWLDGSQEFPHTWYWRQGQVSNDRSGARLFPYFHFMVWKKHWQQQTPLVLDAAVKQASLDRDGIHLG